MSQPTRSFHEDHMYRQAQSFGLAYTRALNAHDGSAPLFLHQEMDFLGHFEPDLAVSLALVPEVLERDPVAGLLLLSSHLDSQSAGVLMGAMENQALSSVLLNQIFGTTNLPGNLAKAIEAAVKARFTRKMAFELRATIASGKSRTVRLASGVELKAIGLRGPGKLGKQADVMIRVRQKNAKQLTLVHSAEFKKVSKYLDIKSLGPNALRHDKVLDISRQASDELWKLRRLSGSPWLSSAKVGGVLTFAPTLIGDFLSSFDFHAKLGQMVNWKQFAVASMKNQTGNLLAVAGGFTAAKVTVLVAGALSAVVAGPVLVVIGAVAGLVIGVLYFAGGYAEQVERKAKAFFGMD